MEREKAIVADLLMQVLHSLNLSFFLSLFHSLSFFLSFIPSLSFSLSFPLFLSLHLSPYLFSLQQLALLFYYIRYKMLCFIFRPLIEGGRVRGNNYFLSLPLFLSLFPANPSSSLPLLRSFFFGSLNPALFLILFHPKHFSFHFHSFQEREREKK